MDSTTVDTSRTDAAQSCAAQPAIKPEHKSKPIPRYHVILFDDDDHTYAYVVDMLRKLFGFDAEQAYAAALEIDTTGSVILDTTTKERAEFKRDQIHAFGRDWRIDRCAGCMTSVIEPEA
jgi:ATP-dependent Clp protease adaptor protein ClpS